LFIKGNKILIAVCLTPVSHNVPCLVWYAMGSGKNRKTALYEVVIKFLDIKEVML